MKMTSPLSNLTSNPKEDHGPLMSVTTWSLTGVAFVFLVARLIIRQSQGKLWLDDLVLSTSWLLLMVQCVINQLTINLGFGKHALDLNFTNLDRIAYYGASSLTVSCVAITLGKLSFGVTLLRLTDLTSGWPRWYVVFAMTTLAVFAMPVAVIPWVQCKPLVKTFVDFLPGTCIDKHPSVVYGRFQAVWSAIMDIALALLPWKIIWKLQMRKAERIGVCVAMSLGVLAGAAAVIRARYIELLTKQDLSYDAYNSVIWSVAEAALCVIATSIPVLRWFIQRGVTTVIETYLSSSGRSKSRSQPSEGSRPSKGGNNGVNGGSQPSSQKTTDILGTLGGDTLASRSGRGSKGYLELDDLIVDESTGRAISTTAESRAEEGNELKVAIQPWPSKK